MLSCWLCWQYCVGRVLFSSHWNPLADRVPVDEIFSSIPKCGRNVSQKGCWYLINKAQCDHRYEKPNLKPLLTEYIILQKNSSWQQQFRHAHANHSWFIMFLVNMSIYVVFDTWNISSPMQDIFFYQLIFIHSFLLNSTALEILHKQATNNKVSWSTSLLSILFCCCCCKTSMFKSYSYETL